MRVTAVRVVQFAAGAELSAHAARVRDGGNGVLEDQQFVSPGFQEHREFVEAFDAARQLCAVQQEDGHRAFLAPNGVEKRVLNILRCWFRFHSALHWFGMGSNDCGDYNTFQDA